MKINNELIKKNINDVILTREISSITLNNDDSLLNFIVQKNEHVDLLLIDVFDGLNANFFVEKDASLTIKFINSNSKKNVSLHGILNENSEFNMYFADFAKESITLTSNVILLGDNSSSKVEFSTVSKDKVEKNYFINFDHIGKSTTSVLDCYGVSENEASISVKGISHIEKNSIKSNAIQKAKVILFDKNSKGKASPILKIDCDDIKASHACAIGSLNEDHIYYLLSRGINISEARKLVVLGYLLPIKNHFTNQDDKEYIENYVRGEF